MGEMRALTIKPPWSHAIAHGSKRIENRGWPAPAWVIGRRIAIHAGKSFDWDADFPPGLRVQWAAPEDCALGAVVAVATLDGCHHPDHCRSHSDENPDRPRGSLCSPWAMHAGFHWTLAAVRPLPEPIPCRGALGLWRLPDDVESAVRAQLEATHA